MLAETGLVHQSIQAQQMSAHLREASAVAVSEKLPAVVDHAAIGGRMAVCEVGAILLYLAEKTGRFAPDEAKENTQFVEWLFWSPGRQKGPSGNEQLAAKANQNAADQAYRCILGDFEALLFDAEARLAGKEFLFETYSIADMAVFPWVFIGKSLGLNSNKFPNVSNWWDRVWSRPGVREAINSHTDFRFSNTETSIRHDGVLNTSKGHPTDAIFRQQ